MNIPPDDTPLPLPTWPPLAPDNDDEEPAEG